MFKKKEKKEDYKRISFEGDEDETEEEETEEDPYGEETETKKAVKPEAKPKATLNDVLLNFETRIQKIESILFRLRNI